MPKYFVRNIARYRIRGRSVAAQVLNLYMSRAHTGSKGCLTYDGDALDPIRALNPEESVPVLLLGYEHFLWLFDDSKLKDRHGDNVIYASGLDFAIQVLARKRGLRLMNDELARLVRTYLTHPHPTLCLPPSIIVGLISKQAGRLARARELGPETAALLRRMEMVLKNWNREDWGAMPPPLLARIQKALELAAKKPLSCARNGGKA